MQLESVLSHESAGDLPIMSMVILRTENKYNSCGCLELCAAESVANGGFSRRTENLCEPPQNMRSRRMQEMNCVCVFQSFPGEHAPRPRLVPEEGAYAWRPLTPTA